MGQLSEEIILLASVIGAGPILAAAHVTPLEPVQTSFENLSQEEDPHPDWPIKPSGGIFQEINMGSFCSKYCPQVIGK